MDTPLNDGDLWYLEKIIYGERLDLFVIEGIESDTPTTIEFDRGDKVINLGEGYPVEVTDISRRFRISFSEVFAFHRIDESVFFPTGDELATLTPIRQVNEASYLDYVNASFGALTSVLWKEYDLFGIYLADDVVYVISDHTPQFHQIS